jgi:hypothetical protein
MRIIALVADPASIQAILAHMGEPTRPPPLAPARNPPACAGDTDAGEAMDPKGGGIDPLAQPEPEYIFDRRILWSAADHGADGTGLSSACATPSSRA